MAGGMHTVRLVCTNCMVSESEQGGIRGPSGVHSLCGPWSPLTVGVPDSATGISCEFPLTSSSLHGSEVMSKASLVMVRLYF